MNAPTIVSMKDIRLSLAAIARRVEAGERFIVVRDSKPVFQIEPLTDASPSLRESMSFREITEKIDRVRDPGAAAWTPESVEQVIREMYREGERKDKNTNSSTPPKPGLKNKRPGL